MLAESLPSIQRSKLLLVWLEFESDLIYYFFPPSYLKPLYLNSMWQEEETHSNAGLSIH